MLIGIVKNKSHPSLRCYVGKKVGLEPYYIDSKKKKESSIYYSAHDLKTGKRIGGYFKKSFKIVKEGRLIKVRSIRCL